MAKITWPNLANDRLNGALQTAAGTALANSVAETIISQSSPDITFNPNELYPGKVLEFWAAGEYSTTVTPTLQLRLRWGGVAGVVLLDTTAITTISGAVKTSWRIHAMITVRTEGATGTVMALGHAIGLTTVTALAQLPANTPVVTTIDTTAAKALVLTATWGAASASNTITCHQFVFWEHN